MRFDLRSFPDSHFYPGAEQRFPALLKVPHMSPLYAISLTGFICEWPLSHWTYLFAHFEPVRPDLADAILEVRSRRSEEED